jgi:hypothetical protein
LACQLFEASQNDLKSDSHFIFPMSTHRGKSSQAGTDHTEQQKCTRLLEGFVRRGSRGDQFIRALCPGKELCLGSLKVIGLICENATGIRFDRDYQRQKSLMYLWFTRHYDSIAYLTQILSIETKDLE